MRLGYIVTEFPKTTETFIYRELLEFARQGHEVRLYHLTGFRRKEVVHEFARPILAWARTFGYLLDPRVLRALVKTVFGRPGTFLRILGTILRGGLKNPVMLFKTLLIVPKSLAIAEDLRVWGCDHVHAGFATHPATAAWIVKRVTGIPYSVSCHAHDIFVTMAMLDFKLREAALIRPISEFNRCFLLENIPDLRARSFAVIHIGLDLEEIRPLPPADNPGFRILYAGSLIMRKGVDVLLRALVRSGPSLGDWRLDLMGDGSARPSLERLVAELNLGDRVVFHGKQPVENIFAAYAGCDVMVAPSIIGREGRTEGIPTVLVEALAHQRPVIATEVSGVHELVRGGETGWMVAPSNDTALADALLDAYENRAKAGRLAAAGRKLVEEEFNLKTNAERLLEAFASSAER